MRFVVRHFVAITAFSLFALPSIADDSADIAIIDTASDTTGAAAALAEKGVTVIGRYYGRCPQWNEKRTKRIVPDKRMIDNPGEVARILDEEGMAILSVYQFYSQKQKFSGSRSSAKPSRLDDRPRVDRPETIAHFNDCITPNTPNTIEEDARLDVDAAVIQAKEIIKQPPGTTIYFGVDFDLEKKSEGNVVKYFRIIGERVRSAGYLVGVYGNGRIADRLLNENLVDSVWLTASPAHTGSAAAYNSGQWDLLQTKTDTEWKLKTGTLGVDTNMQNPKSDNAGFWNRSGPFSVPSSRNQSIHSDRRFVCEGHPVFFNKKGQKISTPSCTRTFGATVRIFEESKDALRVRVDCNEDGVPDAWMKVDQLSIERPEYIYPKNKRLKLHCNTARFPRT